jgi:sigma-B regulation protein RsbU (phosphoserine phosphatase)
MEEGTTRSRGSGTGLLTVRAPAAEEPRQTDAGLNQSAGWAEPLQRLALALVRAVSLDDVAAAIAAYGTVAAGARWSHVLLLGDHGTPGVSLLAGPGLPSCRLDTPDLGSPAPWNDALRQAGQLAFPSTDALLQAYPDLKPLLALETRGPVITTPLVAVDDRCGAVTFGFDGPPAGGVKAAGDAPLDVIAELSGRAAVRAAVYAGEHQSAELLQRAYLPTSLSPLGDLSFASRYLPAGEPVGVGGDWYDLLSLPDGRIGVVMGDVAGHGLQAAVVMASLRGALRAFSTVEACPAGILSRLNDFTCLFKPDAFATVFVGLFEAGQERIRYARAGHPPPLLVSHDGSTEVLTGALGPPLGFPGAAYEPGEEAFPVGTSLVAYTDGLIERRDESLESRLADLVAAARAGAEAGPEDLCDRLVFDLLAGHDLADDAALLVVTRQDPAR